MTEDQPNYPLVGRRWAVRRYTVLALAIGACMLPVPSRAAGPTSPAGAPELGALLATNTDVLSENDMAEQKGSGLRSAPVIGSEPGSPPKVLLWDEMRLAPLLNPPNQGVVIGGPGGK